jgi:hypothetical protein
MYRLARPFRCSLSDSLDREGMGVMAEERQYVCNSCGHSIETWSDGNPYYIDKTGAKK